MKLKQEQQKQQKIICATCKRPTDRRSTVTSWLLLASTCKCSQAKTRDSAAKRLVVTTGSGQKTSSLADEPEGKGDSGACENDDVNEDLTEQQSQFPLATKYKLQSLLGQGGMGAVYKVQNRALGKTFAVKMLREDLAKDKPSIKRFEQEAKAASNLTHPNLVAIYDYGLTEGGAPYLVMDYLDGKTLEKVIKEEGFLDVRRALELFLQICDALAHAHGKRIIHRDLKPSNILLVDKDGADFVKIVDFGIAKIMPAPGRENDNLTKTGDILGSPLYMSPEQCMGYALDTRSDIYSFGCLMYETLTGSTPFSGDNPVQIIFEHMNSEPKHFSDRGLEIAKDLDTIVLRCLEKDAEHRYQSVEDLQTDLLRFSEGLPLSAAGRWTSTKRLLVKKWKLIAVSLAMSVSLLATAWSLSHNQSSINSEAAWHKLDQEGQDSFDRGDYKLAEKSFTDAMRMYDNTQYGKEYLRASLNELLDLDTVLERSADAANVERQLEALNSDEGNTQATQKALEKLASEAAPDKDKVTRLLGDANDVAVSLIEAGDGPRAASILKQALNLAKENLGTDHAVTARTLHNQAYYSQGAGDYDMAVKLYKEAATLEARVLTHDDPAAARTFLQLGRAYIQVRAPLKTAEDVLTRALNINRKAFGPESDQVAWTRYHLALLYELYGKTDDARSEVRTALASYEHINQPSCVDRKASCYLLLARLDNNLQDYQTALAILESETEKHNDLLCQTLRSVADLIAPKNVELAEPYLKRALALALRVPGAEGERMQASLLQRLASVYRRENKLDLAEKYYQQALPLVGKCFGEDSVAAEEILAELGGLLVDQGDSKQAESILRRALIGINLKKHDPEFLKAAAPAVYKYMGLLKADRRDAEAQKVASEWQAAYGSVPVNESK